MESLLKQIRKIAKKDPFNGHITIETPDDDLRTIIVHLHVDEGIHRGANYAFRIEFGCSFLEAYDPPHVFADSPIYHPNMEEGERICCNLFKGDWESGTTLESMIATLYCLLENPAFDNPLNRAVEEEDYEEEVQRKLRLSNL